MTPPVDIVAPRDFTSTYTSGINNLEANFRYKTPVQNRWTTFLVGFRYLDLTESLTTTLADPNGQLADEVLATKTINRLYGAQIGLDVSLSGDCRYCIDLYGRAGIYGNDASTATQLISVVNPPDGFTAGGGAGQTSFLGEIGIKGRFRLNENLNFYSSYNVLFLEGVALAPDQIAATDILSGTGHSASGGILLYGGTVGLEFTY